MSLDRFDNSESHNANNVRCVPNMFNCVDENAKRTSKKLVVPEGMAQPYKYHWGHEDVAILRALLRSHFGDDEEDE